MNIVKELLELRQKVNKLYCLIGDSDSIETYKEKDPTVAEHIKAITVQQIENWDNIKDNKVGITVPTNYATVEDNQAIFNKNIAQSVDIIQDNFLNLQIEFDLIEEQ